MRSSERTLLSSLGFADPDKGDDRHDLACHYLAQPDVALKVVGLLVQTQPTGTLYGLVGTREEHHLTKGQGQYCTTIGFLDVVLEYRTLTPKNFQNEHRDEIERWRAMEETKNSKQIREFMSLRHVESKDAYFEAVGEDEKQRNIRRSAYLAKCDENRKTEREMEAASATAIDRAVAALSSRKVVLSWEGKYWIDEATGLTYSGVKHQALIEVKIAKQPVGQIMRQLALYETYIPGFGSVLVTDFDLSPRDVDALIAKGILYLRLGEDFDRYCHPVEPEFIDPFSNAGTII